MTCSRMDIEGIRSVISVMQKNLECPICLELMKEPVATKCDHIFCKFCMLQLLSKKKKGTVPCPLCKTEVTRRSLQESHRFKLLVEGQLKIIKAFEFDSGYKFFPSQEHTKGLDSTIEDVLVKEDQSIVHCKGYRNRKKGVFNSKTYEETGMLSVSKAEEQFAKEVTRLIPCRQKKPKKEAALIFSNCVPNYSDGDLLKKENGLRNDCSPLHYEKEDTQIPEMEEMAESDLAECEFAESAGSNLLGFDGPEGIPEISAETSINAAGNCDFYGRKTEQFPNDHHCSFKQNIADAEQNKRNQHCGNVPFAPMVKSNLDEKETVETDFDNQHNDSNPENNDPLGKVTKLMRRSTERVNEWLLKTNQDFSTLSAEEDPILDALALQNKETSDKRSCSSDDSELMPVLHKHAEKGISGGGFDKPAVGVKDKIFCKVYKRERKAMPPNNITCVAEVHHDSALETGKENMTLEYGTGMSHLMSKRKMVYSLNPENTSKKNDLANINGSINVFPDCISDANLELEDKSEADSNSADACQSDIVHSSNTQIKEQCVESLANAGETRKKQELSCERSQEEKDFTQSGALGPKTCSQQSPYGHSELHIESSQISNEPSNVTKQVEVRRSRRLLMLPKGPGNKSNSNAVKEMNEQENIAQIPEFRVKETNKNNEISDTVPSQLKKKDAYFPPCTSEDTGELENGIPVRKISDQNASLDNPIDPCKDEYSDTLLHVAGDNVQPDYMETEESELETQHIVKMFKTSKRTSFILESKEAENENRVNSAVEISQVETSNELPNVAECRHTSLLSSAKEQSGALLKQGSPSSEPKKTSPIHMLKKTESKHSKMSRNRRGKVKPSSNSAKNTTGQPDNLNNPTQGVTGSLYNKQVMSDCPMRPNVDEEHTNASAKGSQSSVADKSTAHSNINTDFISDINSATPDGLLHYMDKAEGNSSPWDTTRDKNAALLESCLPSAYGSTGEKTPIPKVQSSEEGSSQGLFNQKPKCSSSGKADQKNSSKNPGKSQCRILSDFSGSSNNGKCSSQEMLSKAAFPSLSQESQCSVSLFSTQSNMSQQSVDEDHKQDVLQDELVSPNKTKRTAISGTEETQISPLRDQYQNPDIDEASECESEASHTGDSSILSSQDELLNTQQRNYMKDSLKKLQQEMAALEAVLGQHGTQKLEAETTCIPSSEHVTEMQEATEEEEEETYQGENLFVKTPPEHVANGSTLIGQSTDNGLQGRNRPVSPSFLCQTRIEKDTPEIVCPAMGISKKSLLTQKELPSQHKQEIRPDLETVNVTPTNPIDAQESLRQSSKNKRGSRMLHNKRSTSNQGSFCLSVEAAESPQIPKQNKAEFGIARKSTSPTFASPARAKVPSVGFKSPVVSSRRNLSFVASGLNQCEMALVQRFSKTTQSILSSRITDSTTHVIMKTDAELVCERTLKYFQGIASRKWVVSYEWVVQSFREGQILDEYDFEVKGDVINGRNHRGPRRSRLGSDGLLLIDFEICFFGSFTDMTLDDLEWMVSECGATVVKKLQFFKKKHNVTSLVIVQPDASTEVRDYTEIRKKHKALVVTREWLMDSVATYRLQKFDAYLA
uniref:RING-type E3 ubiquitin transferase n=1 Tax=Xenopus laevis TaxID=8355 RepID=B7ZRE7_XENLA|nr:Breast and ovarian cancer susceptibility protein [Xenopus laevis]